MRRFLFTAHDAGGTIPPMLAVTQALVDRGHEVTVLSQPSVRARAEAVGCRFAAFSSLPDYERHTAIEEQAAVALPALTGRAVGDDLLALVERHAIDLVVVDANLAGALAAAETLAQPSVVLLHSMYATFVSTWFADIWPLLAGAVNDTRAGFGLDPVDGWASLFTAHDRLLSVVPRAFEAPVADPPPSLCNVGFLVPQPTPAADGPTFPAGDGPTVLVGLSTTYQSQERLLGSILAALGQLPVRGLVTTGGSVAVDPGSVPANVLVEDFVAHPRVLPAADAMVTHAGLGSVAAALSFGVPLVCTPLGRDQPLNAERVTGLGAGVMVDPEATTAELARAIADVATDPSYREAAAAVAGASREAGGPEAVVDELEALLA